MSLHLKHGKQERQQTTRSAPLLLDVQIQQSRTDGWSYTWDRDQTQLRLIGWQAGHADLPADLAILHLSEQAEIPIYVFSPLSIAADALVTACVLGAFRPADTLTTDTETFPLAGWTLFAVPNIVGFVPTDSNGAALPLSASQRDSLLAYLQARQSNDSEEPILCSAAIVAQRLREARVWLKHAQRQQPARHQDGDEAIAWRSVAGLTPEQREHMARARSIDQLVPFLQAELLIHFVPQRFQHALEHLLLPDERLLVLLERPRLHHRMGWPGMQRYRANAGLFLVTDRQALWVRDFFSPGASQFPEGYIARSVPLERLADISLVPAGVSASSVGIPLAEDTSPYLRLVLTIESDSGRERYEVAFPTTKDSEQAVVQIQTVLRAFVPLAASQERHLRRLPMVDPWMPQGAEARRLAGLGGVVAHEIKQRLEHHLAETLRLAGEEQLLATIVPALEEFRSPARLVALTRTAVLLFDAFPAKVRERQQGTAGQIVQAQRYDLARISSVQLSYSLLGSSLRLFLPQAHSSTLEVVIPFHSPAIAWFLPLFTRLRLTLSAPLPQLSSAEEKP